MSDYWSSGHETAAEDLFYLKPGRRIYVDATYGSDGNGGNKKNPMKILTAGYSQLRTGKGDTLFLGQGNYILASALTWAKDDTNCVGLCENIEGDYTQGGVNIYTIIASVAHTIDLTGDRCLFQNMKVSNGGANAANLGAMLVEGYGGVFKKVAFMGIHDAAQIASAAPYSLGIGWGGYFPYFEDCVIGQNTWGPRTQTLSGHLKFTGLGVGSYPPDNGTFKGCKFLSWAATATLAMVYVSDAGAQAIDRLWLFEDCKFYNFDVAGTDANEVFDDQENSAHNIVLKDCTAVGYDEWQDKDHAQRWIQSTMPIPGLGGGLGRQPTAVVGT